MPRYEYPSLRHGLVGAWCPSLGASGLTLIDRSGYGIHSSAMNGFSWSALNGGPALSGNGTTSLATLADRPQFRVTSGTVTGWFRSASLGTGVYKCIFASYAQSATVASGITIGINIGATGTNQLGIVIGKNTGNAPADVGHWYSSATVADSVIHSFAVAIAQDASVVIYVDGVATTTTRAFGATVSPVYATTNYVGIGAEQTGPTNGTGKYWPGLLDDIRIYNRVLTLSEIRLLASRRGIGLSPLPDRGGGLPRKMSVNVGGTWRAGDAYVNTGSGWRLGIPYVNVGGTFR